MSVIPRRRFFASVLAEGQNTRASTMKGTCGRNNARNINPRSQGHGMLGGDTWSTLLLMAKDEVLRRAAAIGR